MASLSAVCGSLGVIRHRVSRDAARTQCRHFFARGWRPAQASRSEYSTVTTGLHSCISCKVYCSVRRAVKLRTADTRDTDSRSLPHYTTPPGPCIGSASLAKVKGMGKPKRLPGRSSLQPVSAACRPRPSLCETQSAEAARPRRELSRIRGRWNGDPHGPRGDGRSSSP